MNELQVVDKFDLSTVDVLNGTPTPTCAAWLDWLGGTYSDRASRWGARELYTKMSWFIVTQELVDELALQLKDKKVADLGCGSGFLISELRKRGVDIVGYDMNEGYNFVRFFIDDIRNEDFSQSDLSGYDVLISTWPSYESNAMFQVVSNMLPGQTLYYQGEGFGGCTADDAFHEALEEMLEQPLLSNALNQWQPQWDGIHDRWETYVKQDTLALTSSRHALE